MSNLRIPVDGNDKNIRFNLEQEFDQLEVLSLKLNNEDVYSNQCADFGVLVGRVNINGGFGVQNAKVSVFVPLTQEDQERPEITRIYPFTTVSDTFPNGLRYNLLPRVKQKNPSHQPVGTFPDVTDLSHYSTYREVFGKYYKYTTTTNEAGDFMIFGVPLGTQFVHMDFDLFDTNSFEMGANDLVAANTLVEEFDSLDEDNEDRVEGFIYLGGGDYEVEPKTNISDMPNIFGQTKQVNITPFWGDEDTCEIGITRCDFNIDFNLTPTAIFFGAVLYPIENFSIKPDYSLSESHFHSGGEIYKPQIDNDVYLGKDMKVIVYKDDDDGNRVLYDVFDCIGKQKGMFRLNLPMYKDYQIINEFGQIVPSNDSSKGIPIKANYYFEIIETDDFRFGRYNRWGGYSLSLSPGLRVPADRFGDGFLAGWNTNNSTKSLFEFDIVNGKQQFYTLTTHYAKHRAEDVSLDVGQVDTFTKVMSIEEFNKRKNNFEQLISVHALSNESTNNDAVKKLMFKEVDFMQIQAGSFEQSASDKAKRINDFRNRGEIKKLFNELLEIHSYFGFLEVMYPHTVEERNDGIYFQSIATVDATAIINSGDLLVPQEDGVVTYLPKRSDNESLFWNYPVNGFTIDEDELVVVYGSAYIPKIEANGFFNDSGNFKFHYPTRIVWYPWKSATETSNNLVRSHEWLLGLGTSTTGINKSSVFDEIYGRDIMDSQKTNDTYYYGHNPPFGTIGQPNSVDYVNSIDTSNPDIDEFKPLNGVFPPYNLYTSDNHTDGLFVQCSDFYGANEFLMEFSITNITNELDLLISNKVYSSYGKNADNKFNGRYYYFGKEKGNNILYNIEQIFYSQ